MMKNITSILCTSILVITGLFVYVGEVQAYGCQYTQNNAPRCANIPSTQATTPDEARRVCDVTCQRPGRTGCTAVTSCTGGSAVPGGSGGGTGPATPGGSGSGSPQDTRAQVVALNNPITTRDIQGLVGIFVNRSFGLIGTLAVVAFIYGGFLWLTAAGSEEKVKKGGQVMVYATIGIVVIFSSYAILNTILQGLTKDTFLEDTDPTVQRAGLPVARPRDCTSTPGFSCQDIDNCEGVNPSATPDEKRAQCAAPSNRACWTGLCSGGSSRVCCKARGS